MIANPTGYIDRDDDDVVFISAIAPQDRIPDPDLIVDLSETCIMSRPSRFSGGDWTLRKYGRETNDECPICLEPFSLEGQHRVVVTKCGHMFGFNCISKALGQQSECPNCRSKVRKRDLIQLYSTHVTTVDTTAVDKLKVELEGEKQSRKKPLMMSVVSTVRNRARKVMSAALLRAQETALRTEMLLTAQ
eukprot:gene4879-9729_t